MFCLQLEIEKCGCSIEADICHYEPDKELPNDGKDKTLKQVFCETYNTNVFTEKLFKDIYERRTASDN